MKNKHSCDLKTCFLCRKCLPEWLLAVEGHRTNASFNKGQLLFQEGEEVKGIYFLYKGKVKVHKHWGDNKELIVRFAGEGDIVGHRGLGKNNIYPISATALEPCIVCFIDLEFFRSSIRVNSNLAYDFMLFYAEELQESEKRMRNLAHMPAKGRIADALLLLLEKFGKREDGNININITRQDIASFAGTTYETTFRTINELAEEGIVETAGKNITIKKVEALSQLLLQPN